MPAQCVAPLPPNARTVAPPGLRDPLQCPPRRLDVDPHAAAEERLGAQDAEHHIGVRNRGLLAAKPEARRPGLGASASRPNAELSTVELRDRATAEQAGHRP